MKILPNFILQEFVPKSTFKTHKENSVIFLDDRIVHLAQFLRDRYDKPMVINTWHTNKNNVYNYRGYRPFNTAIGAKYSQHKFGRAIDFHIPRMEVKEIYEDIINNQGEMWVHGMRGIENVKETPTWIHVDCRLTELVNELMIF